MVKATRGLSPAVTLSKLDPTDWTRAIWRAAYAMARAMARDRRTTTAATAWTWFLQHARRRFTTPAAWRIAQLAGRACFDRRTPMHATTGSVDELLRQGLVRRTRRPRPGDLTATVAYRCAAFERLRDHGFSMAWSFDQLASSANKGLRVQLARQLRADRARRREVDAAMAEDRLALDGRVPAGGKPDPRDRFALTDRGRAALAEARS